MNEKLPELPLNRPVRVLFVCLGNICRSPAAEGIFRQIVSENGSESLWEIDSAGIGGWHAGQLPDNRMRVHARRRGYELTHRARQVRESDFDDFDLIIGMDSGNIADLRELARTREDLAKIHSMSEWMQGIATRYDHVPDPYYEGAEGFELVLDLLENACRNLAGQI
ncbi:MAG: low molecular weight phosphotyrosine protein phosphatase [Muribaculaceae bacterium]|nr:low molecular weight phosphotyrosine protein phosphatase [Muribaculaceae bacterium]